MSAATLACLLLAAFFGLELARPHLPAVARRLLTLAFALLLAAGAMEIARYDHGHPDWLQWIGWVGAPVIVIFGAAAAGVRRWYGWPDLGPLPGRLALLAGAILVGVLVGSQVKPSDVDVSVERAETLRRAIAAWRDAHGGAWPARLEDAAPDAPRTRMGWVAPPPFAYDPGTKTLAFPIRTGAEAQVDLATPGAPWKKR